MTGVLIVILVVLALVGLSSAQDPTMPPPTPAQTPPPPAQAPNMHVPSPSDAPPSFEAVLTERFRKLDSLWTLESFCPVSSNVIADRVLREYGAFFVASESVIVPRSCIHAGESEVLRFQRSVTTQQIYLSGVRVVLQAKAAEALMRAANEAYDRQLNISPLDGAIAGSRTYGDTLMLWNGRFFSGLDYWTRHGRLTQVDRDDIGKLDLAKRIEKVLEWESQGIWFSTDKTRSILTSTAPPGTSQHLAMLAFDVTEYGNPEVRQILNRNGWYQTVAGDPPHFTFLDMPESALPQRGLRAVAKGGFLYWVPNMSTATN